MKHAKSKKRPTLKGSISVYENENYDRFEIYVGTKMVRTFRLDEEEETRRELLHLSKQTRQGFPPNVIARFWG